MTVISVRHKRLFVLTSLFLTPFLLRDLERLCVLRMTHRGPRHSRPARLWLPLLSLSLLQPCLTPSVLETTIVFAARSLLLSCLPDLLLSFQAVFLIPWKY